MIDKLYDDYDKNNFYLGMISQVYKDVSVVQVENLSWLNFRKIKREILIPNTINFFVVVESVKGIFLGEVYQSKIPSTNSVHDSLIKEDDDKIYPEISINVIAVMAYEDRKFSLAGFSTVGITDKVYIANSKVIDLYLKSVEIKDSDTEISILNFAKLANMPSKEISLMPSTMLDRHLMAIGTTNSGKSTTSLSILDKLINYEKKVLIIDPTGEYSNSFEENENMKKLILGKDCVLDTGRLTFTQWATLFETNDSTQPAVLADAIKSLRFQKKNNTDGVYIKSEEEVINVARDMGSLTDEDLSFDLTLLSKQVVEEAVEVTGKDLKKYVRSSFQFNQKQWLVQKIDYKLSNTSLLEFFSSEKDGKMDLIEEIDKFMSTVGSSLYIDASKISVNDSIGATIIDLISSYIIDKKEKDNIAFVMFVDEVHRYASKTLYGDYQIGLTSIAREGRKKGIFLFLTTQNPQDVSKEVLGQVGTLLVHRLTHKNELEAIRNHLSEMSYKQIVKLNQGEAILTSINLLQDLHLQIIKSSRVHFNSTTIL